MLADDAESVVVETNETVRHRTWDGDVARPMATVGLRSRPSHHTIDEDREIVHLADGSWDRHHGIDETGILQISSGILR